MPALRLKTKLVVAITAMVVVIVLTLAAVHISDMVHQNVESIYNDGDFLARTIFQVARRPLEVDLSHSGINERDPQQVADAIQEELQSNVEVNSLLDAVVGYNPNILDAAIVDTRGRTLLFSGLAIVFCIVLAVVVSNVALGPMEAISLRLDQISAGHVETGEARPGRSDEYGAVSSKIDRLGRQR